VEDVGVGLPMRQSSRFDLWLWLFAYHFDAVFRLCSHLSIDSNLAFREIGQGPTQLLEVAIGGAVFGLDDVCARGAALAHLYTIFFYLGDKLKATEDG